MISTGVRGYAVLLAAAIPLVLGSAGCEYETYEIVINRYQVEGIAISDWRDVETDGKKIMIHPGGRFAIRIEDQTQYLTQLDIVIRSGSGAHFYTRTVPHKFSTEKGEMFEYAVEGATFRQEDGRVIPLEFNADEATEEIIKLLIEADLTEVSVGCERLYQGRSSLEATEYIIIEAKDDAEIEIVGVNVYDIDEI